MWKNIVLYYVIPFFISFGKSVFYFILWHSYEIKGVTFPKYSKYRTMEHFMGIGNRNFSFIVEENQMPNHSKVLGKKYKNRRTYDIDKILLDLEQSCFDPWLTGKQHVNWHPPLKISIARKRKSCLKKEFVFFFIEEFFKRKIFMCWGYWLKIGLSFC